MFEKKSSTVFNAIHYSNIRVIGHRATPRSIQSRWNTFLLFFHETFNNSQYLHFTAIFHCTVFVKKCLLFLYKTIKEKLPVTGSSGNLPHKTKHLQKT